MKQSLFFVVLSFFLACGNDSGEVFFSIKAATESSIMSPKDIEISVVAAAGEDIDTLFQNVATLRFSLKNVTLDQTFTSEFDLRTSGQEGKRPNQEFEIKDDNLQVGILADTNADGVMDNFSTVYNYSIVNIEGLDISGTTAFSLVSPSNSFSFVYSDVSQKKETLVLEVTQGSA